MKRLLRSDGFDVIVVGSGLAGLSAALTVAEFGYSPVILEKACEPGGLTRRAYGFFNAADARRQIALGIDDSPEKHLRQALEVSRGKAREPLMRTLCYEAYSTLQWLEALGLEFEPGIRRVLGGVYPRTHMPLRGAGEAYLSALRSALRPFGVPIVCNAEVTALRKSGDAVTGVEGLLSGESFRLTSRLGVVLAGGGFSRNMEMMRLYAPGLSDVLPALDEGADGSLIQAAADIGAALVGMSYFEVRLFASTLGLPARRTQPVSKCNSPVNPGCSILRGQSTLAHSPPSPSQFFTPIANVGANSFKQRSTDRARFRFFDACSCS